MHPILGQLRRLGLYALAWIPLCAILLYLLAALGGLSWARAATLAIPLCVVYAFVCLSAWYSCRGTPLETSSFSRLALTHLSAAVVAGGIWTAVAKGLALAFSTVLVGLDQQVSGTYALLFGSGVLLYLLAVALHYVLLLDQASHEAEKREAEARVLARESELKALKTQVNPHFIFNCLNSISALTTSDSAKAREMCVLLADFLRKTLGLGEKTLIPLRDELTLTHSFLSVEQIRFGARLRLEEKMDPAVMDFLVPPLLLQPLVENAVGHGISNLTEGGWIRIEIERGAGESLKVRIENNFDPETPRRRGAGIGLKNVRLRLDAAYGSRARFDVRTECDRFTVALEIPAEGSAERSVDKSA
jgi:two-component system, LytTR family, sensor histidine kinase AlgZ